MNYKERIISDSRILLGKPVIKGTRISVELILQKLSSGYTSKELLEMYPSIEKDDISACLQYAAKMVEQEEVIHLINK